MAVAASNNPALTTLTSALSGKLNPNVNLVDTLNNGQYTVFAPTDAAFAQIGVTSANCAAFAPSLTNVLAYHVAKGRRDAADVVSSTQIRMLNGETTGITSAGGSYYINNAKIIATDVFASNGVIHAIDKVLIP